MTVHAPITPAEAAPDFAAVLADPAAPLAKVMEAVAAAEAAAPLAPVARVGISAGSTVALLSLYLRRHALLAGLRAEVSQGDFDNPLEDLDQFVRDGVEHVVLAPFLDSLAPAFEARAALLSPADLDALEAEVRARWRLALSKAAGFRSVVLCGLHRLSAPQPGGDRLDEIVLRLNRALREEAAACFNVRWIDMGALVGELGRRNALDLRFYFRNAAPYTSAMLDAWARQITLVSRAYRTRWHKALVLDCDNTLWGGVLGEDLATGIKLSPTSYPGSVFFRVQTELLALQTQGVLLCLCSKNNPEDVEALISTHPDMVLRPEHIAAVQVNWSDKVENLQRLAETLNIGLDSLVFLDDSSFECEAVRTRLPQVTVFQVPASLPDYPGVVHAIRDLFLAGGGSSEGAAKTEQYRQRAEAIAERESFGTQEDYLASLQLTVTLSRDAPAQAPRISELSQKSNQFNLTTVRYTPADIERLMRDEAAAVYTVESADRFGSAGLIGAAVVRYAGETAAVENLFFSCRVLGRGVEFALWPTLVADAAARGCTRLEASYRATAKNAQTADFYHRLGLPCTDDTAGVRTYRVPLADFAPQAPAWIEVRHGR